MTSLIAKFFEYLSGRIPFTEDAPSAHHSSLIALHKRDLLQEALPNHAQAVTLGIPSPLLLEQLCGSVQQGSHVLTSLTNYEQCQCGGFQPSLPLYPPTSPTQCPDLTGKVSVFPSQELEQKAQAALHGDSLST